MEEVVAVRDPPERVKNVRFESSVQLKAGDGTSVVDNKFSPDKTTETVLLDTRIGETLVIETSEMMI
jgi:hypothetical protein